MEASKDFNYSIYNFYSFCGLSPKDLDSIKSALQLLAQQHAVLGLVILAPEGINTTYAGTSAKGLSIFTKQLKSLCGLEDSLSPFVTQSKRPPFVEFVVKLREEIVTYHRPDLVPDKASPKTHLSPKKWQSTLESEDVLLLDVRNHYETRLGAFEGALQLDLKTFTNFKPQLQKHQIPKDKKVLMYCTGGIRCEKACKDLQESGYQNVYQLEGGILNYMKSYPEGRFKGECFVFDSRVAVDSQLQESKKYSLCPHCGDPGSSAITCVYCGDPGLVCQGCLDKAAHLETCSKNCAYHKEQNHKFRKKTKYV